MNVADRNRQPSFFLGRFLLFPNESTASLPDHVKWIPPIQSTVSCMQSIKARFWCILPPFVHWVPQLKLWPSALCSAMHLLIGVFADGHDSNLYSALLL